MQKNFKLCSFFPCSFFVLFFFLHKVQFIFLLKNLTSTSRNLVKNVRSKEVFLIIKNKVKIKQSSNLQCYNFVELVQKPQHICKKRSIIRNSQTLKLFICNVVKLCEHGTSSSGFLLQSNLDLRDISVVRNIF